ncbi:ATP-binding protein [Pseudobacteriovorax antillogorgiicola]|uniref:histidine kinase n=1 Tax=Pseudobacteriovorax antillogorgiicola TaxID=1513793 RepID=A0A1Y6CET9_9BACT|nr:ATP-binding protein [Pseudobacteriovorax antillogorgiicola]TCS47577.1 Hpt domain-containing protein [Pseudobacteriovorax antillogorgiicola]SMF60410.1 Hpt domain-containing protein [Pseudobacteriovorax antillogorgiicola]
MVKYRKISEKLSLKTILVVVVGLAAFSMVLSVYNYENISKSLEMKSQRTLELGALSLKGPVWDYDSENVAKIAEAILQDADVLGIEVRDKDNTIFYQSDIGKRYKTLSRLKRSSQVIYLEKAMYMDEQPIGRVAIAISKKSAFYNIRLTVLIIILFAIIACMSIIYSLQSNIKSVIEIPINRLTVRAIDLAKGNLEDSIETTGNDELAILSGTLEEMRQSVKRKISDLDLLNDSGVKVNAENGREFIINFAKGIFKEFLEAEAVAYYRATSDKLETLGTASVFKTLIEVDQDMKYIISFKTTKVFEDDESIKIFTDEKVARLVVIPIASLEKNFGYICLTVEEELKDTAFIFCDSLARIIAIRLNSIELLEIIEENNRNLEATVKLRTRELRHANAEIKAILKHIRQGIFTISEGLQVDPEYSEHLQEILETRNLAGSHIRDVLLDHSNLSGDQKDQVLSTLGVALGDDPLTFEANMDLLPKTIQFEGERAKILDVDWHPVLSEGALTEKIIITVRDMTEFKELESKAKQQEAQIRMIGELLDIDKERFRQFKRESLDQLDLCNDILESDRTHTEAIPLLFRNIHTVKGNARLKGLSYVSDEAHGLESLLDTYRQNPHTKVERRLIKKGIEAIRAKVLVYSDFFENHLLKHEKDTDQVVIDQLESVIGLLHEEIQSVPIQQSLAILSRIVNQHDGQEHLHDIINVYVHKISDVAEKLSKPAPQFHITMADIPLDDDRASLVRKILPHLMSNSLSHGIEKPKDRMLDGKAEQGQIFIQAAVHEGQLQIEYWDDGKGLDLEKLRKRGRDSNSIANDASDFEIANLIFTSGISTTSSTNDISGRGVGLDAVKSFIEEVGGQVALSLVEGDERTRQRFRFHISLPISQDQLLVG